jgi:uncharacterized protein (DUF1684 family)
MSAELELTDWRRKVNELYAAVRADPDPAKGHALWREGRDDLFLHHPQSPLEADDPLCRTGISYWPYDPAYRFEVEAEPVAEPAHLSVSTGGDSLAALARIGRVQLPAPVDASVDLWWLDQYGGGMFVPFRDGTAGRGSYGGGRYALDTAKGADLGGTAGTLIVDLNFLYHPSCRYSDEWVCPLAPPGNTVPASVQAGERL